MNPQHIGPFPGNRSYVKSSIVMATFGYKDRGSFWQFVYRAGVPHVRLGPRRIMFDGQALADWIESRSTHGPN